jgi:hypothetical protein
VFEASTPTFDDLAASWREWGYGLGRGEGGVIAAQVKQMTVELTLLRTELTEPIGFGRAWGTDQSDGVHDLGRARNGGADVTIEDIRQRGDRRLRVGGQLLVTEK